MDAAITYPPVNQGDDGLAHIRLCLVRFNVSSTADGMIHIWGGIQNKNKGNNEELRVLYFHLVPHLPWSGNHFPQLPVLFNDRSLLANAVLSVLEDMPFIFHDKDGKTLPHDATPEKQKAFDEEKIQYFINSANRQAKNYEKKMVEQLAATRRQEIDAYAQQQVPPPPPYYQNFGGQQMHHQQQYRYPPPPSYPYQYGYPYQHPPPMYPGPPHGQYAAHQLPPPVVNNYTIYNQVQQPTSNGAKTASRVSPDGVPGGGVEDDVIGEFMVQDPSKSPEPPLFG